MYEWISQYLVLIIIAAVSSLLIVGGCYWLLIRNRLEMRFDLLGARLLRIMKERPAVSLDYSKNIEEKLNSLMENRAMPSPDYSRDIEKKLDSLVMHLEQYLHSTEKRLSMMLSEMSQIKATQVSQTRALSPIATEKFDSSTEGVLKSEYDVFLSYSSKDEEEANKIYEAITFAGGKIFLASKSLRPGDDFSEKIRMALSESRELWLLVSPNSLKSDWVVSEWGAAWALGKDIVPILHRCDLEHLPERISRLHCTDFYKYPDLIKIKFKR
jgi:TIR domain-containing protein